MKPASLAEVARRSAADPDGDHHLREFLDTFYAADADRGAQAAMLAEAPALLRDARADAFIGGAGEHLARRWGLPVPRWVRHEARHLTRPWFVPDLPDMRGDMLAVAPVGLRVTPIFTGPDPLQRARFPYRHGVISPPLDYPPAPS